MAVEVDPEVRDVLDAEPWLAGFVHEGDTVAALRSRYAGAQRTYTRRASVPARLRRGQVRTTTLDQHQNP